MKKVTKLLTYGGQVIDPTAYIYIYICMALDRFAAYVLAKNQFLPNFIVKNAPQKV